MRIKLWANGGLANTNREEYHEVPEDEWNSMTKDEQEALKSTVGVISPLMRYVERFLGIT